MHVFRIDLTDKELAFLLDAQILTAYLLMNEDPYFAVKDAVPEEILEGVRNTFGNLTPEEFVALREKFLAYGRVMEKHEREGDGQST